MPSRPVARTNSFTARPENTPPKMPSGEQAQHECYSNRKMTGWTLIVDNVSTTCIAHPEQMKVSA
jgi:hypothetical protein